MSELILILAGFLIGWYGREIYAKHMVKKLGAQIDEIASEVVKESIINIDVEKHDDTLFVYKKDGTFLAQGKNIDELTDILQKKFPGKLFNASPEHMKLLENQ